MHEIFLRRLDAIRENLQYFNSISESPSKKHASLLKSAPHGRKQLSKWPGKAVCSAVSDLVCGGVFVRISPRKAERKISVMFGRFKMADEDRQSDKMALTALFSSSFSSKNPSQEI